MRLNVRALAAVAVLSLLACSSPEKNPPLGAPEITSAALEPAHNGLAFTVQLEATPAEPPVSWTFAATPPASLSWLSLTSEGLLSGTPPAVNAGASITVRATDAGGRSTDKTFTVVVDLCADGAEAACSFVSGGACTVGTATCAGGTFGSCIGGLSTVPNACGVAGNGVSCGACDASSDTCVNGLTCQCGGGAPCATTHAVSTACSGGACTYSCENGWRACDGDARNGCETSLTTVTNCGACGSLCNAPTNGSSTCATGICQTSCPAGRVLSGAACICDAGAGYTDCSGSCVNLTNNRYNCGTCGNECTTNLANRVAYCSAGNCLTRCATNYILCNNVCIFDDGTGCGGTCFVAGTPVTLADGSTKAIDEIVSGDRVLAMDTTTSTLTGAVVAHPIFHRIAPVLLRINGRLTTTPEHRFYVDGDWRSAIELRIGDVLVTAEPSGSPGTEIVTQLELLDGNVPVYNLEVEGLHDYFAGGVLVHNAKQIP